MSSYKLDIRGDLSLSDYSNVYDYISIVGNDDKFTLSMDGLSEENRRIIVQILKEQKFNIEELDCKEGIYYINASK